METEIVHLDTLLLGGMSFYGDPISAKGGWDAENEIGKTWSRFGEFVAAHQERAYSRHGSRMYEVHVYGSETASKGYFEVFVGEEVNTALLPVALCCKTLPESDYMKITLRGREITGDWWQTLDSVLLPVAGLKRNTGYIIQAYDERFKGMNDIENSVMEALIPLEKP